MSQSGFRNFDSTALQSVRVKFERMTAEDFTSDPTEYLDKDADAERIAAFRDGRWGFMGLWVKATIDVPIGGGSFCSYELESAGLWGIEDDGDEEYLATVESEERAALIDALAAMGAAALHHQAIAAALA